LRGDLDAIAAKALEKDRDRRYASAAELAQDLRRHLSGEPILARGDSGFYVLRRQVRKHRVMAVASALVVIALAVAAVVFGKLADRIGTKPVLVIGWTLLAAAAFGGMVIQRLPETVAVVVLAGIGNGAATAAGWPLLAALVPSAKTGVFAGLKAAAESIAIPASVVVAAEVFLPAFSYRGVFVLLAGAILIALVILIRFVRAPALPNVVAPRAPS
jgi:serine/threonine-protein kinase